ncbi:MAG: DUF2703 domain-containing protein [Pseudomonadota bacterium]
MRQTIIVEWKHLEKDGKTCDRCVDTGKEIRETVKGLQEECGPQGVEIIFRETTLSEQDIGDSNIILINGKALEDILPRTIASENTCCSCSELIGKESVCRTIVRSGMIHEVVPSRFIREAICEVARCC